MDKHETSVASIAIALEHVFPKPAEASTPTSDAVKTPTLGTIYEEEVEFSNMIGAVEVTDSPITDAIMSCLYGPQSPQRVKGPM